MSLISHFCVLVAAIVVSEIIDKLSPNIAPLTTAPTTIPIAIPVLSDIPTAIGTSATIVPIDVPTDSAIKHATTNIPDTKILAGNTESPRLTVESTAPIAFAICAKAPAKTNISIIRIISGFPAPLQKICNFSSNLIFLFIIKATIAEIKNGIITETA